MMGFRYSLEHLLFLRDSPMVIKPDNLPPIDEWMGIAGENAGRAQAGRREGSDRHSKGQDGALFDQTNRRTVDRHSRGSANPEDIVLGPPKMAFTSSTSIRNANKSLDVFDKTTKDGDSARRSTLHSKLGDLENDRNIGRDGRRPRRGDGDQLDPGGWETVKPRKSFGAEGAERMFSGRMGGEHKDDRRIREPRERDHKDRPARGFDNYSRDKEIDHENDDVPRKERNGVGRGRNEPSWFKDNKDDPLPAGRNGNGNRHVDSNRGWREKDRDDAERGGDRADRGDRRWNRDIPQRQEHAPAPEWMAEADDEKKNTHTMEDFEKWKKSMKASNGDTPAEDGPSKNAHVNGNGFEAGSFFGPDPPKVDTPLGNDTGHDKFFNSWTIDKKEKTPDDPQQEEGPAKAKVVGKASRFNKFFTAPPTEEPFRQVTEPAPTKESVPKGDFQGLFGSKPEPSSVEKEAFAALLQKLHSQSIAPPHSTPPANTNPPPPQVAHEARPQSATAQQMSDSFNPYHQERQEEQRPSARNSQHLIDLLNQKQSLQNQHPSQSSARGHEQMLQESARAQEQLYAQEAVRAQEQKYAQEAARGQHEMLQDIFNQRQKASSQSSGRVEQVRDPNSDFMLSLMQGQRGPVQQGLSSRRESQAPNSERFRQMDLEAQAQAQAQAASRQQKFERDQLEQREQRDMRDRPQISSQQQQFERQQLERQQLEQRELRDRRSMLPPPRQIRKQDIPPGYFEEQMMQGNFPQQIEQRNVRPPQQPTQILQRPPGLDNGMSPTNWGGLGQQSNQLLPQVQQSRHIQPPPGLPGAPSGMLPIGMQQNMQNMNQNMQIPSGFPPGFPPGMAGGGFEGPMQRSGPMPPPPGFFAPPPGFMQQQQQLGRGGMNAHGGYDNTMNPGSGAAFLQGQMFDGRQIQGQPQGPLYRR